MKLFRLSIPLIFCLLQIHAQESPPNFLLIQVDDMGYDDLAFNGNSVTSTPSIDALAEESIRMENFMLASVCAPTRASLMTGRDFWRTGMYGLHGAKDFLHPDEITIADILNENGYTTGMWGKWHVGKTDGYWPWDRGFDEGYYAKLYKHYPATGVYNDEVVSFNKWSDEVLVDYAIDFMDRNQEQPFFAYLSSQTCHTPWKAPADLVDKYMADGWSEDFSTLLGMLEYLDMQLGRLLNYLDTSGLAENTIVLFMSDNGPNQPGLSSEEWAIRNNHGFLGSKSKNWQNGLKSPLYIRWPNKFTPGEINRLVSIQDIFPTIIDLANIDLPGDHPLLNGRSFLSYLEGDTVSLPEKTCYFPRWDPELIDHYDPILQEEILDLPFEDQKIAMITEHYKLIKNPWNVPGSPALFENNALIDLLSDPLESTNIASNNSTVYHAMLDSMENWFQGIKESEHPFVRPVFQIAWEGDIVSEVPAYGCKQITGVINQSHNVIAFDETGDKLVYDLMVHQPGYYILEMSSKNDGLNGMTVKSGCGENYVITALGSGYTQEIGTFFLGAGPVEFSFEVFSLDASKNPFLEELRLFEFTLTEAVEGLSDPSVTRETALLFERLKKTAKNGMIFGHQHATIYGQAWRDYDPKIDFRSDCNTSVGDHPGLFGFDVEWDHIEFQEHFEEIFRRNGIITLSFHAHNPVTGGNYHDKGDRTVAKILEGGQHQDTWFSMLDKIAVLLNNIEVDGIKVPVIFRPLHEHTGSWFWWGIGNCTEAEFVEFWKLTVDYLRIDKGVNNMLLAWSPSKPVNHGSTTFNTYPGNDYVDIIGFDAYESSSEIAAILVENSRFVSSWADTSNKVAAITEFGIRNGLQNSTNSTFFTTDFLEPLKSDTANHSISHCLTWSNFKDDNYWLPLPGQQCYPSFKTFYDDPYTIFLRDMPDMYDRQSMNETYTVKIRVIEESSDNNIEGAIVWAANDSMQTDDSGTCQFEALPGNFFLKINKENFQSNEGEWIEIQSDTTLTFFLKYEIHYLRFLLLKEGSGDPLSYATVTIEENSKVSNPNGHLNFYLPYGSYNYEIEKRNFQSYSGTIDLQRDTSLNIGIVQTHADLKFRLREDGAPVRNASVVLADSVILSNLTGISTFQSLEINHSYAYQVLKTGYDSLGGIVFLQNDSTLEIEMTKAEPNSNHLAMLSADMVVWPNPAENYIYWQDNNTNNSSTIKVYDQQGKLRIIELLDHKQNFLEICDLSQGLYHVNIYTNKRHLAGRFVKL